MKRRKQGKEKKKGRGESEDNKHRSVGEEEATSREKRERGSEKEA